MSSTGPWKQYKSLRLQAFLSSFLAVYMARIPWDLSRLSKEISGDAIPTSTVTHMAFQIFPMAALLVAVTSLRWLRFACPECEHAFLASGPKMFGHDVFVNPMATECRNCGLVKGQASLKSAQPVVAELVAGLADTNLVSFEKLSAATAARLATMTVTRKQA